MPEKTERSEEVAPPLFSLYFDTYLNDEMMRISVDIRLTPLAARRHDDMHPQSRLYRRQQFSRDADDIGMYALCQAH